MLSSEAFRVAALLAYLGAWIVFAIGALVGGLPQLKRRAASPLSIGAAAAVGSLLQVGSALAITYSLNSGPLRPRTFEIAGVLVLAPLAAALFVWALRSTARDAEPETLVTAGAYAWLRHPIYLAFFAMLVATGLLVSNAPRLVIAMAIYVAGSELRIASEEKALALKFPSEYVPYCLRTPWRYLPGLR